MRNIEFKIASTLTSIFSFSSNNLTTSKLPFLTADINGVTSIINL